jgi:hypothetical protein
VKLPIIETSLGETIAAVIFLILFGFLLYGSFKAHNGESFGKQDMHDITQTQSLFEIKNASLSEE